MAYSEHKFLKSENPLWFSFLLANGQYTVDFFLPDLKIYISELSTEGLRIPLTDSDYMDVVWDHIGKHVKCKNCVHESAYKLTNTCDQIYDKK